MKQEKQLLLQEKLLESYNDGYDHDGVSGKRLASRLDQLAQIGLTDDNGSNRPGYSKEEKAAQKLVSDWMREAGLKVYWDGAGNVIGRLDGKNNKFPAIMSGSHLDSVPNGGHFDGTLGVLSSLEVVEAWNATGYQPEKPFEVIIFTDEEGSRFNGGLNGSEAMIGEGDMEEKLKQVDKDGMSFTEVLEDVGLNVDGYQAAQRNLDELEMFVELHIEQGKRLEKEQLPCGIVTGIAGPCWIEFTITGKAGHAGNTPMDDRNDALVAASQFIYEVNKIPQQVNNSAVATVGKQIVEPNGVNVIPGKVTFYVDIRDIQEDTRDEVVDRALALGEKIAEEHQVRVEHTVKMREMPIPIQKEAQDLLAQSVEENGIRPYRLPSGAGHDAAVIGRKIPVAMLFVQSKDGISHNPAEWSDLNDCVQGIHVLKNFLEKLQ
ncbi:M20 family metallo-hydrolase [Lentibacillus sp. L22]|uniref:M20 family metallo-hydrolase n=1 Tax=Lentibacillus TaxID=175304 RepID=UPI0022B098B5|nr:M20 family metallo-hydrolase [Lentibacillus daqui]